MKKFTNIFKTALVNMLLVLVVLPELSAQDIVRATGSNCVGIYNEFDLNVSNCYVNRWIVSSTPSRVIEYEGPQYIELHWTGTGTATITAECVCNGQFRWFSYSEPLVISNPVTPSVSITANTTTFCRTESGNVTFTATPVNGGVQPRYYWKVNGTTITSTTTNTFTRAKSSLNNSDVVSVLMVADESICVNYYSVSSNGITMTVTQPAEVSAQVAGSSVICSTNNPGGASYGVTLFNSGSNPVYTWHKNGYPVNDRMSGPPPNVYVPLNPLNSGDKIKCVVSFSSSCISPNPVHSNEFPVTVTTAVNPTINIQVPDGMTYCSGETISFVPSSAYITGSSTYSWKLNGSQFSTSANASLPATTTGEYNAFNPGDVVTVTVSGLSGSCLSSSSATGSTNGFPISVYPVLTPQVGLSASATTICGPESGDITFTATPTNGGSPTYQWMINESVIATTSTNTWTRPKSSFANGNRVKVVMTTSVECPTQPTATSNEIIMSVYQPIHLEVNVHNPGPICAQTPWTFDAGVSLSDDDACLYTWYVNGVVAREGLGYQFAQFSPLPLSNGDSIRCKVTYTGSECVSGSPASSERVVMTVIPLSNPSVVIDIPSGNTIYCDGDPITFEAQGNNLSSIQWRLNNSPVGTNSPLFTTSEFTSTSTLTVTGNVTGTCLTSNTATATVDASDLGISFRSLPDPVISPSGTIKILSTESQTITATPSGSDHTYQWKLGESNIPGATQSSYTASEAGIYTVAITPVGCTTESARTSGTLNLQKNALPVANAGPPQAVVLPASSITITGTASDGDNDNLSYLWTKESGPSVTLSGVTTPTLTVSSLKEGDFVFRFTVYDGLESSSSTVTMRVQYPPNNHNYIRETAVLVKDKKSIADVTSLAIGGKVVTTSYFDGLGRPMQSVVMQGSPSLKDIVQPIVYDNFNREARKYLPFTAESDGYYKPNIIDATGNYTGVAASFYSNNPNGKIAQDARPFSETIFEPSPLNRPLKDFGPGEDWHDNNKFVEHGYTTNIDGSVSGTEKIIAWAVSGSGIPERDATVTGATSGAGYYPTGALFVKRTIDEAGHEVREYTDKQGRVILKKVYVSGSMTDLDNHNNWTQTYYIYDDFGNLRFVLQPQLVKDKIAGSTTYNPDATDLAHFAFQYKYDARQRMIEKQVPGADAVYMVYDKRDRLVLTQDGNQRNKADREWSFTKYDVFNRPVLTGIYVSNSSRDALQTEVDDFYNNLGTTRALFETYIASQPGNILGYDSKSFPAVAEGHCYTATYYDRYDDVVAPSGYTYSSGSLPGQETTNNNHVRGQVTATLVRNFGNNAWLRTVNYYDNKYRLIQSISDHHKGKVTISNVVDFAGRITATKRTYVVNGVETTIKETFAYDHASRLTSVKHSVNGAPEVITSKLEYNELGQVVDKKLHSADNGTTFQQSIDHLYNIRGWLTKINEPDVTVLATDDPAQDYFGMALAYNQSLAGTASTSVYNGNISAMQWSVGAAGSAKRQAYAFDYDALNRLLNAEHTTHKGAAWVSENGAYNESITEYDFNGNIKKLKRRGHAGELIDDLVYDYINNGNRLNHVTDNENRFAGFVEINGETGDYDYDSNGNMIRDRNKGILTSGDIKYNYLNLPVEVVKGNEKIKYIYDATGRKLAQEVYNGFNLTKYTDYIGELIYEGNQLRMINHAEGRVLPDGSNWEYQYHLKDHLGNVRVTFTAKPQTTSSKTANFEADTEDDDRAYFKNYSSSTYDLVDHTDAGGAYEKVQGLNGGVNGRVGLAKSYSVMPGDQVSITAYAKYMNLGQTPNTAPLITSLAAAFGVSSSSMGEELKLYNGLNSFAATVPEGDHDAYEPDDDTAPKAFVTIIFLDRNYNLLDAAWDQITSEDGAQTSPSVKQPPHDELSVSAVAKEPGFAYIFVSNEHPTAVDVYFDDVTMTHVPSPIISSSDYYPFGLAYGNGDQEGGVDQPYLYNGKELQNELNLGWLDYGARMYMPELGRWGAIDLLGEKYPSISPYIYVGNNPVNLIDPDGMDINVRFVGEEAKKLFQMVINQILGGQFVLSLTKNEDGSYKANIENKKDSKGNEIKGDINKLSVGGQAFYKYFKEVTDDHSTVVNLNIAYATSEASTGDYDSETIDMADVMQWPEFDHSKSEQSGTTQPAKILHETREQYARMLNRRYRKNDDVFSDHKAGVRFENAVNKNIRLDDTAPIRNGGVIERFELSNGSVVQYRVTGGYNSPSQPVIRVVQLQTVKKN